MIEEGIHKLAGSQKFNPPLTVGMYTPECNYLWESGGGKVARVLSMARCKSHLDLGLLATSSFIL